MKDSRKAIFFRNPHRNFLKKLKKYLIKKSIMNNHKWNNFKKLKKFTGK